MRYQLLFENFIAMVTETMPQNAKLSTVLSDILQIEKEAVYRRLRMEVPFTFAEIATISQSLGLSIDNIIGSIPKKSRPLKMTLVDYTEPTEIDYIMMENYVVLLRQMKNLGGSEYGTNCNTIPLQLYYKYEHLTRFHLFKWVYFSATAGSSRPFADITITDRLRENQLGMTDEIKQFSMTNYIWDKLCLHYLVEDIKHFRSVYLITPEEVALVKEDLRAMLAEMESIACNGCYPDTGKKVNFYISSINFDTCYEYLEARNNKLSMIRTFLLNGTASQEERTYDKIKTWINSLKRVSTLISETGEKQRVMFFEKQRELIDSL